MNCGAVLFRFLCITFNKSLYSFWYYLLFLLFFFRITLGYPFYFFPLQGIYLVIYSIKHKKYANTGT